MSGVAIVNQIVFIFNLTIFGGLGGASIFGAQFAGKKDHEGVRYTLRFRLVFSVVVCALGILVFLLFGGAAVPAVFEQGVLFSGGDRPHFGLCQGVHRHHALWASAFCHKPVLFQHPADVGETFSPMVASLIAICVNLTGNYLLIYGSFGFPKMGVAGAALATVIARWAEMGYLLLRTWRHRKQFPFLQGLFRNFRVPLSLVKQIAVTGTPLLLNETLWSIGTAAVNMCYPFRGLEAVAPLNINSTVWNLFAIVMAAMGNAIGILSGQLLGANDIPGAKDTVRKLLFFSVCVNAVIGGLIVAVSPLSPYIYNTEPSVRQTATHLLMVSGSFLPLSAYTQGTYFTIRSGGKPSSPSVRLRVHLGGVPAHCLLPVPVHRPFAGVGLLLRVGGGYPQGGIGTVMLVSGIWAKTWWGIGPEN